mmetsp:Transcript_16668/g.23336  ORF Transcript_16668/g.23336 Transcript_16668/m.23336 type:complete len:205 (-) Transcript_16668:154-768(-)
MLINNANRVKIHVDSRARQLPEFHRVVATRQHGGVALNLRGRGSGISPSLLNYFLLEMPGDVIFHELAALRHEIDVINKPRHHRFLMHRQKKAALVEWHTVEELRGFQQKVKINLELQGFLRDIVAALRHDSRVLMGPTPEARRQFSDVLKLRSLLNPIGFVRPRDFASAASQTLSHRIRPRSELVNVNDLVITLANKTLLPPK